MFYKVKLLWSGHDKRVLPRGETLNASSHPAYFRSRIFHAGSAKRFLERKTRLRLPGGELAKDRIRLEQGYRGISPVLSRVPSACGTGSEALLTAPLLTPDRFLIGTHALQPPPQRGDPITAIISSHVFLLQRVYQQKL